MGTTLIGITSDIIVYEEIARCAMYPSYARAVVRAGGVPVLLTHEPGSIDGLIESIDGFVFTGGDDPRTEQFGEPTDPRITPVNPDRQGFEVELLRVLGQRRADTPVLGVCLGMQMMALVAGGKLDQHMPDASAEVHWEHEHAIVGDQGWTFGKGPVLSRHRQAVSDPGRLRVLARASDSLIEAVDDPERAFYLGVQWHPERTLVPGTGADIFEAFVRAAQEGVNPCRL